MMTIEGNDKVNYLSVTATRDNFNRRTMILNSVALTILFIGYLLTTGTGVLDSDGSKAIFRLASLLVLLGNLLLVAEIKLKLLVAMLLMAFSLMLSQSQLALNIIFLLLIAASLARLRIKELAIVLIIPTAMVVGVHLLLLTTGVISAVELVIGDRTRSALGLANPNQVSALYFSLVANSTFLHIVFKQRASFLIMVATYILAFSIFIATDSRTSLFGAAFLASLILLHRIFYKNKSYRFIMYLCGFTAPILAAITTIYLINFVGSDLDIILSFRPYVFSEFIAAASVSDIILGWGGGNNSEVDNLFLSLLSAVGIIGCVGIIFFIAARTYKMKSEFIPLVITLMLISIFEAFLLRPEIPISVLFVSLLFLPLTEKLKVPERKRWRKFQAA